MSDSEFISRRTLTVPRESIDFALGTMIGEYKIVSLMSEGSQATLFRVCDRASTPYVLRVYFDGCSPGKELTNILLNSNDNKICKIIENGNYAGHDYDIIPFLKTLPDIRYLSDVEQNNLIEAEAKAIKRFHQTGFCHLDIKKEHFMSDGRNIKLIDIASARKTGSTAPDTLSQFLPLNAYTGAVMKENDLFSFGIAILEQFLPDWLEGKNREQIATVLSSYDELQKAIRQIPSHLRDDVQLLLSDAPDMRNECKWFRTDSGNATASRRTPGNHGSLSQITNAVKQELLAVAVFCAPEVFATTVKDAGANVDFQNTASVQAFLMFLQGIPRGTTQVNYTNLNYDNVIQSLKERVIIDYRQLSKNDPIKTLHNFQRKNILFIFDRQLIERLDEQGVVISNERDKRAFAVLKTIGIILGVIAGIGAAIAVIALVIYIFIYIVVAVVVIAFVCALISGS